MSRVFGAIRLGLRAPISAIVIAAIGGDHPRNGAARMKIFNPFADMPDNPLTRAIKEGYKPLALFL